MSQLNVSVMRRSEVNGVGTVAQRLATTDLLTTPSVGGAPASRPLNLRKQNCREGLPCKPSQTSHFYTTGICAFLPSSYLCIQSGSFLKSSQEKLGPLRT